MKNSGLLLILIGIFLFLNAGNFTDVIRGRSHLSFLNPKTNQHSKEELDTAKKAGSIFGKALSGASS